MSIKSQLKRLEELAQAKVAAARPKAYGYKPITIWKGEPLTERQRETLAYNRSLDHKRCVGFGCIIIDPQPARELGPALRPEPAKTELAN